MKTKVEVLTEHISDSELGVTGEDGMSDVEIYERDMEWLMSCDAVIGEVTAPSLGVGYEIGCAELSQKPVLCLFDKDSDMSLSASRLAHIHRTRVGPVQTRPHGRKKHHRRSLRAFPPFR